MMKRKHVLALTALACLLGGGLYAQQGGFTGPSSGQRGFTGPSAAGQVVRVADVKNYPDDAKITLQGNILRHLGGEKYAFSDGTGEIVIEIDHKLWRGLSVSEKDRVEIYGEVDIERDGRIEIDVKTIVKK